MLSHYLNMLSIIKKQKGAGRRWMLAIFSVKNTIISARGIPSRWDVIGQKKCPLIKVTSLTLEKSGNFNEIW